MSSPSYAPVFADGKRYLDLLMYPHFPFAQFQVAVLEMW